MKPYALAILVLLTGAASAWCQHRWVYQPTEPYCVYLYEGDTCRGAWYWEYGFRSYDPLTRRWADAYTTSPVEVPVQPAVAAKNPCGCNPHCTCDQNCNCADAPKPCSCCCTCKKKKEQANAKIINYGVDVEKLTAARFGYKINGRQASREEVLDLIQNGIPDDRHKLRLTIIGSEEECRRVLDDLEKHPELAACKNLVLVQSYRPTHWAVRDVGFVTTGHPTIYLQAPDGRVLHRQDDYQGGAERLSLAIRKADPSYRPDKDPDLTKPAIIPFPISFAGWMEWVIVGAAILFVLVFTPRGVMQS